MNKKIIKKSKAIIKFYSFMITIMLLCLLYLNLKFNPAIIFCYLSLGFILFFSLLCYRYNKYYRNKTSRNKLINFIIQTKKKVFKYTFIMVLLTIIVSIKIRFEFDYTISLIIILIVGSSIGCIAWELFIINVTKYLK